MQAEEKKEASVEEESKQDTTGQVLENALQEQIVTEALE